MLPCHLGLLHLRGSGAVLSSRWREQRCSKVRLFCMYIYIYMCVCVCLCHVFNYVYLWSCMCGYRTWESIAKPVAVGAGARRVETSGLEPELAGDGSVKLGAIYGA